MATLLYLTPADQGRALTLEEFERAGALEGFRYELIDGRLDVSPEADLPHDRILSWLNRALDRYADNHPEVLNYLSGHARVFVPGQEAVTAPEPDITAYQDFPLDRPFREVHWQNVSPILVVEILSEDTADKDLERNRDLYVQVPSIREYWIFDPRIDPEQPTLTVFRRRGRRWMRPVEVPAGGVYTTRLLPDFSLVIAPHQAPR